MSCGCPVICSNRTAMSEVADGAALFLEDPKDPTELKENIEKILENKEIQKKLRKKGKKVSCNFTWNGAAEELLEIYNKLS